MTDGNRELSRPSPVNPGPGVADTNRCLVLVVSHIGAAPLVETVTTEAAQRLMMSPMLADFIDLRYTHLGPQPGEGQGPAEAMARITDYLSQPRPGVGRSFFAIVVMDRSAAAVEAVLRECAASPFLAALRMRLHGVASREDRRTPRPPRGARILVSPVGAWRREELIDELRRYADGLFQDFAGGQQAGVAPEQLARYREEFTGDGPGERAAGDGAAASAGLAASAGWAAAADDAPAGIGYRSAPDALDPGGAQPAVVPPVAADAHAPGPDARAPGPDARAPGPDARAPGRGASGPDVPGPGGPPPPVVPAPAADAPATGPAAAATRTVVVARPQRTAAAAGPQVGRSSSDGQDAPAAGGAAVARRGRLAGLSRRLIPGRRSAAANADPAVPPSAVEQGLTYLLITGDASDSDPAAWTLSRSALLATDKRLAAIPGMSMRVRVLHGDEEQLSGDLRPAGQLTRRDVLGPVADLYFAGVLTEIQRILGRDRARLAASALPLARPAIVLFSPAPPFADSEAVECLRSLARAASVTWVIPRSESELLSEGFAGVSRVITDFASVAEEVAVLFPVSSLPDADGDDDADARAGEVLSTDDGSGAAQPV